MSDLTRIGENQRDCNYFIMWLVFDVYSYNKVSKDKASTQFKFIMSDIHIFITSDMRKGMKRDDVCVRVCVRYEVNM